MVGKNNNEICCNCEYVKKSDKDINQFVCRRNPPYPNVMQAQLANGMAQMVVHAVQPPVEGNGWCGEFSLKITMEGSYENN